MNDGLTDAFRHNSWATASLVAASRHLPKEKLASTATGTYGDVVGTLNHLVLADAGYLRRLSGLEPSWLKAWEETSDLEELASRVEESARNWETFLSEPVDAERPILLDQGTYEAKAGVVIAQALNHGNVHREQVCAILTGLGVEPPDLQAWAWGEATGRGGSLQS